MSEPVEVIIVGGGIIGLVLTVGLLKAGIKVKVYEQAQGFREIGAGIAFTANAIRCMNLIDPDVPAALRSSGSVGTSNGGEVDPNDYLRWIDGYDRKRGAGAQEGVAEDKSTEGVDKGNVEAYKQELFFKLDAGYRGFEGCRRDMFLEALVKAIPEGVIELKKRVESIEDRGDDQKLLITFRDGSTTEADAVIGCDGVKSRVRRLLLGENNPASSARYSHCVAYRTLLPMASAVEALGSYKAMNQHNHVGPNANLLHYPVANNTMINAVAFIRDPNDWADDSVTVAEGTREDCKKAFEGWCPPVQDLVDRFPDTLSKWAIFDLWDYPVSQYNKDRVCLAGDAAHASSPHHGAGACQGIEDALCLTVLMREVLKDVGAKPHDKTLALRAAFATYDAVRRTRSQWLVDSSRRVCDLHQQKEWAEDAKLVKARTVFEEIRDRSLKIWHFDYEDMVEKSVQGYEQRRSPFNGVPKNSAIY